jgi:ketosteroid isomerase-like protein
MILDIQPREGLSVVSTVALEQLQSVYRQWSSKKGSTAELFLELMSDDVKLRSIAGGGKLDFTRHSLSKQQVADYFQDLTNGFEMNFYRTDELLAARDFVLMIGACSFKNKATAKTFTTPKADLWRFEDGKAVEFFEYYDTAEVLASTR